LHTKIKIKKNSGFDILRGNYSERNFLKAEYKISPNHKRNEFFKGNFSNKIFLQNKFKDRKNIDPE